MAGLVVVGIEDAADVSAQALAALDAAAVRQGSELGVSELEALAARATVLWLPPRTILDGELAGAIGAWCAAAGASERDRRGSAAPRVALARPWLVAAGVELPLARRVVLSQPGAVTPRGGQPRPRRAAVRDTLPVRWTVRAPDTLSEHLLAINAETERAARALHLAGQRATLMRLGLAPLGLLARGLLGAQGDRRLAAPRAALEAYRASLTAAKLWELDLRAGRENRHG